MLKKPFFMLPYITKKRYIARGLCFVLAAAITAGGMTACASRNHQQETPVTSDKGESAFSSSEPSADEKQALPERDSDVLEDSALYEDILLNFGAERAKDADAIAPLRMLAVSFYYLPDTPDFTVLLPEDYFSWYLSMSWKEPLTDEQRMQKYASPYGENTGFFFPEEFYEPLVEQYFGIPAKTLRTAVNYRAAEKGYWQDGGGGVGMRSFILLDRAEPEGDLLRLYITLIPSIYSVGFPNEYKILTVRMGADGSYQYLSYMTDENPAESQTSAGQRDYTGKKTGSPALYQNKDLGITITFPEDWKDHYVAVESETYFMESDTETGPMIQFCYQGDTSAVLANVTGVPKVLWPEMQKRTYPIGAYLGENDTYIFVGGGSWNCPYPDGPDATLFETLSIVPEELAERTAIA